MRYFLNQRKMRLRMRDTAMVSTEKTPWRNLISALNTNESIFLKGLERGFPLTQADHIGRILHCPRRDLFEAHRYYYGTNWLTEQACVGRLVQHDDVKGFLTKHLDAHLQPQHGALVIYWFEEEIVVQFLDFWVSVTSELEWGQGTYRDVQTLPDTSGDFLKIDFDAVTLGYSDNGSETAYTFKCPIPKPRPDLLDSLKMQVRFLVSGFNGRTFCRYAIQALGQIEAICGNPSNEGEPVYTERGGYAAHLPNRK